MKRPTYIELQHKFGRSYVAYFQDGNVHVEPTFDELIDALEARGVDLAEVELEFVEPPDVIGIY